GRMPDNDIQIKDASVSAHHAKIVTFFKPTYIKDLMSTNGSYVNGKQIQEHTLEHGDVITIGQHHIIFDKGDGKPPGKEPEMTQSLSLGDKEQVLKYAVMKSGLSQKDKNPSR
ncbi:MAG: FHA domain-containing protein, partial [Gammaproteobacteria bacterium]|nr:FHA domain-containing protein [Gammaproteobacteria bacterium]